MSISNLKFSFSVPLWNTHSVNAIKMSIYVISCHFSDILGVTFCWFYEKMSSFFSPFLSFLLFSTLVSIFRGVFVGIIERHCQIYTQSGPYKDQLALCGCTVALRGHFSLSFIMYIPL